MQMLKEFKQFAMRGNVIDMAVGVIIGSAFGKIVDSLVKDILMPPLGLLVSEVDFSQLAVTLKAPIGNFQPVTIRYGMFVNNIVNFLIVAFSIFVMIRFLNRFREHQPPPAPTEKKCPECLMNIPINARRCAHCTVVLAEAGK